MRRRWLLFGMVCAFSGGLGGLQVGLFVSRASGAGDAPTPAGRQLNAELAVEHADALRLEVANLTVALMDLQTTALVCADELETARRDVVVCGAEASVRALHTSHNASAEARALRLQLRNATAEVRAMNASFAALAARPRPNCTANLTTRLVHVPGPTAAPQPNATTLVATPDPTAVAVPKCDNATARATSDALPSNTTDAPPETNATVVPSPLLADNTRNCSCPTLAPAPSSCPPPPPLVVPMTIPCPPQVVCPPPPPPAPALPPVPTPRATNITTNGTARDDIENRLSPALALGVSWRDVPFKRYAKIIVTGPERSGTTFVASALAATLEHTLVDEAHGKYSLTYAASGNPLRCSWSGGYANLGEYQTCAERALHATQRLVVHAPSLGHKLHKMKLKPVGVLVVYVARDCLDVIYAQNDVMLPAGGWTCSQQGRKAVLRDVMKQPELKPIFDYREPICSGRQRLWATFQRKKIENVSVTVLYESFADHPLWVPPERRRGWALKQIREARAT